MGLKIGRVGLDVDLGHPAEWYERTGLDSRETLIRGFLRASSIAETKALRSELLEQQGMMVAVTYTLDDTRDGFYILTDVNVESVPVSFRGGGLFPYEITLFRIGGESDTELQSLITGTVLENDHGVTADEARPYHAPAQATTLADQVYTVAQSVTRLTRAAEDGNMYVYVFDAGTYTDDPSWSSDPDEYYQSAVTLSVSGRLRAGQGAPNDPGTWELSNGLVKVTPSGGGTSDGRIDVSHYDGSVWDTAKGLEFYSAGASRISKWRYMSILRNDPEACTLRLTYPSSVAGLAWTLDLSLRRGSRFMTGVLSWSGAAASFYLQLETPETGVPVTPSPAASSAVGITAAATDGSGNRYVIGSSKAFPTTSTELNAGRIQLTTAGNVLPFFFGSEVAYPGGSNEAAADLCLQYLGWYSEKVRAVRR